VSPTEWHKTCC